MATLSSVLSQIRSNESGGNYTAQNPTSTASGAYQFVNGTWQSLTAKSGIGTQYATAKEAPANVQDAVAAYALEQNPNANSSSLWGGGRTGYPLVTNYDVSSTQLAAASGSSLGGGTVIAQGDTSNQGFGSNGASSGELTTDPTTGYTSIPGSSTSASPSTNTLFSGAADVGYTPPAATGGPQMFGLASGVVNSINGWVTGVETAVGNWMDNLIKGLFGSVENYAERALIILLGIVLLIIALWRLLDPSGEKTKAVMKGAVAA